MDAKPSFKVITHFKHAQASQIIT